MVKKVVSACLRLICTERLSKKSYLWDFLTNTGFILEFQNTRDYFGIYLTLNVFSGIYQILNLDSCTSLFF